MGIKKGRAAAPVCIYSVWTFEENFKQSFNLVRFIRISRDGVL